MTVFYDHDAFSAQQFGGVTRYYAELIRRLPGLGITAEVFGGLYISDYVRGCSSVRGVHLPAARFTGAVRRAINDALQNILVRDRAYDIIHQTFYSSFGGRARRRVVTVF